MFLAFSRPKKRKAALADASSNTAVPRACQVVGSWAELGSCTTNYKHPALVTAKGQGPRARAARAAKGAERRQKKTEGHRR
jgi:hypothetical protein